MTKAQTPSAKPFVEQVALSNGRLLRIGYRADRADSMLACFEFPLELLEREIAGGLELVTTIRSSGEVVSQIFGSSGLALEDPRSIVSIDRLVSQTVDRNSLRLEELPTSELSGLLRSLQASIEHVRTALLKGNDSPTSQ